MTGWMHSGPHTLNDGLTYWIVLAMLILASAIMLGCFWYACLTGVFDDTEES